MSKRPEDSDFKQQRLPTWEPTASPLYVIAMLFLIGIAFIPAGIDLKAQSDGLYENKIFYDGNDMTVDCSISSSNEGRICHIKFDITDDVTGPLYVYYEVENFYQNHRRYVKSRSAGQLAGSNMAESAVSLDCDPLLKNGSLLLNPCGLVANSFFNDVFTLDSSTKSGISLDEVGIAWKSDVDTMFKQVSGFTYVETTNTTNSTGCDTILGVSGAETYTDSSGTSYCYYYPDNDTVQYLYESYPNQISPIDGVTDEHFIVWMRSAGIPIFRKLYGKIDADFIAGDSLTFKVVANFEVDSFDGSKGLTITTLNDLGGKNPFLGVIYIVCGSLSLVFGVVYAAKIMLGPTFVNVFKPF